MSSVIFNNMLYHENDIEREVKEIKEYLNSKVKDSTLPVALYLKRNVKMLEIIYALLELNITFIPLDIEAPIIRNNSIIKKSGANCLLYTTECSIDCNEKIDMNCIPLCDICKKSKINNNALAYIIATSGTMGTPKLVGIKKSGFENWLKAVAIEFKDFSKKTIICMSEYTFDMFLIEAVLSKILGMTIVLASEEEQKNPLRLIKLIEENNVEVIQATPSRIRLIQIVDKNMDFLKKVSSIVLGGEILDNVLVDAIKSVGNIKLINIYGPTETTVFCTYTEVLRNERVTIGKPFGDYKVYIMTDENTEVGSGEIAEICVSGKSVFAGYIGNEELNNKAFFTYKGELLYKTGDLGYWQNGKIVYCGRKDNQIKLHGFRIELGDIESSLMSIDRIKLAAAVYNKDNEEIIAFYISDDNNEINSRYIQRQLKNILPQYMIPRKYYKVDKVQYSKNGKLDRNSMLISIKGTPNVIMAKKKDDNTTSAICEIFEVVLESNEEIKTDKSFIEYGVDSLSYMNIIVRIEKHFGIKFDDDKILIDSFKTINDIGCYVDEKTRLKEKINEEL